MEELKKINKSLLPRWKFGGVYRNFQLPEIPLVPYKKRKTPKYLERWRIKESMKKISRKYMSEKLECQEDLQANHCSGEMA